MISTQGDTDRSSCQGHIAIIFLHKFHSPGPDFEWVSLETHSLPLFGESSPCVPPHRRCELPCVRLRNTVRIFKKNPQTVIANPYCSVLGGTSFLFLLSVHMSSGGFIFSPCSIRPHLSTESPGWLLHASNLEMGNVHFFSSFVFSSSLKMTKWN